MITVVNLKKVPGSITTLVELSNHSRAKHSGQDLPALLSVDVMEDYGVSKIFFFPTVLLEIFIPILLIVGYKTRILGSIMWLFTLAVALIFHLNFDNQIQLIMFLKDLAIAGGFLLIASREPGLCSIDYFLKNKKK